MSFNNVQELLDYCASMEDFDSLPEKEKIIKRLTSIKQTSTNKEEIEQIEQYFRRICFVQKQFLISKTEGLQKAFSDEEWKNDSLIQEGERRLLEREILNLPPSYKQTKGYIYLLYSILDNSIMNLNDTYLNQENKIVPTILMQIKEISPILLNEEDFF